MSESVQHGSAYLFLSSSEMWPRQINAAYPGAQFVARAYAPSTKTRIADYFSRAVTGDVWGLLVASTWPVQVHGHLTVTTDDGRVFLAGQVAEELLIGDPREILAAARYWELSPRFVAQLRDALQAGGIIVEDEEPRDDGNLG